MLAYDKKFKELNDSTINELTEDDFIKWSWPEVQTLSLAVYRAIVAHDAYSQLRAYILLRDPKNAERIARDPILFRSSDLINSYRNYMFSASNKLLLPKRQQAYSIALKVSENKYRTYSLKNPFVSKFYGNQKELADLFYNWLVSRGQASQEDFSRLFAMRTGFNLTNDQSIGECIDFIFEFDTTVKTAAYCREKKALLDDKDAFVHSYPEEFQDVAEVLFNAIFYDAKSEFIKRIGRFDWVATEQYCTTSVLLLLLQLYIRFSKGDTDEKGIWD